MLSKRNTTTEPEYHNHPILTDERNGLAADTDILQRIENQFDYAEHTKSKCLFFRLDLHYPSDMTDIPTDNHHFCLFASNYMKSLSRQHLNPQYFAVREQSSDSSRHHYHMAVLLDGQRTRNCIGHLHTAERLWASELGIDADDPKSLGLVNHCDKSRTGERVQNAMMLEPNSDDYEDVRNECFRRASYLAKVNQKNTQQKWQREYFASRIPKECR